MSTARDRIVIALNIIPLGLVLGFALYFQGGGS